MRRVYDEGLLPKLYATASRVLNIPEDDIKHETGRMFVAFVASKGYQNLLSVLGRELRDFLNGLDNLHEFLRDTFPKIRPPSFFCVNESGSGITIEYRSQRQGFVPFFIGWMEEMSKVIYNTEMKITIVGEIDNAKTRGTILRLHFNNKAFQAKAGDFLVPNRVFFETFPFNLVFNRGLILIHIGQSLRNALPELCGKRLNDVFSISRPLIELNWDSIMLHTNTIFELVSAESDRMLGRKKLQRTDSQEDQANSSGLKLRGQMIFMQEWDALAFLGTPIMSNVNAMWEMGLFLNDLCMHDSSREMVLAGEQQAAELKLALEQTFEDMTLLLSDVVGFTSICSGLDPLGVVSLLNRLYGCFDGLTEKHKVYKVETVGDAYLIASGCPVRTHLHAALIAEVALDMVESVKMVKDESKDPPESVRIRVGVHTGAVVAGVVGVKMPRYCLFGSTVAMTELMEQTGADGGTIQTFWLDGRPEESDCRQTTRLIAQMNKEREKLADLNLSSEQKTTGEGWESVTASRVSSARSQASKRASLIQSRRASIVRGSIASETRRKGQK
ncbi:hypothetical protein EG68_03625 [Paragonimus skrjabini miyazakii]|uniref:guanylate cyclase n=1 Tax=Paragonimus skrjabini miyazakii TaxID=59628 RepID=A0A8S9YX39_9TREM|nr:hypothetical protein EG68_03625 [Paragonimus skrjabini miyazakii]